GIRDATVTGVQTCALPIWFGLNMISAISAQGALRFAVFTGTLTAAGIIAFLRRLLHDAGQRGSGPVFCAVDGHPAHRARAVGDLDRKSTRLISHHGSISYA